MAGVFKFTVDAVGSPEQIVVRTICTKLVLRQDNLDSAALDFRYRCSADASGTSALLPAITKLTFHRADKQYEPGDILGCLETVSGSADFDQFEDIEPDH